MGSRTTRWWVRLAVAGVGLVMSQGWAAGAAEQQAQAAVVDLKFVERKEDPNSWYGYSPNKEGTFERPFVFAGGKLKFLLKDEKLRADTNGDGVIDDKDAPAVEVKDNRQTVRVKVAVPFGGKTAEYALVIQGQKFEDQWCLLVGSAAMLEGTFGKYTVRILDGNQDGRFGNEGDRVDIQPTASRGGPPPYGLPWSQTIAIERQLYRMELLDSEAKLKLARYTGPVAEVRIECDKSVRHTQTTLQEAGNVQVGQFSGVETGLFVPGKYRLYGVQLQVGAGNNGGLHGYHDDGTASLELKAGMNTVKVGPPLKMEFTASRKGAEVEFTAAKVAGVAGELYRPTIQAEQGDVFAAYIRAGGKEQKLCGLEFS